ncbi:MAG TPA: FG-GAP-like repeat-containing protein [Chloroflexia bacterium]|nr:FG-GAP-like repeat-containing protein [Chloroflexia bacterium]
MADFNKDNKADLLSANTSSNNISLLLGNGDGTFQAAHSYSVGTNSPLAVAAGDLNKDGNLDIVTANATTNNVTVLMGDGTGGFGSPVSFSVGLLPYAVAVADFSGDGKLDIVTANSSGNNVSLLLGDGAGNFSSPTNFTVGSNPQSLVVADFNGDSKPDIATANYSSNDLSLLLNNGSGFDSAKAFPVGTNPTQLTVVDFNGDGNLDLASANFGSTTLSLLFGNGAGSFSSASNFSSSQTNVAPGDFNLDGIVDLVTSNLYSTTFTVLPNNGASGFSLPASFSAGANPYSMVVADLNGDSKPDLVTANNSFNTLSVLLNTTTPPTAKIKATGGTPQNVVVGSSIATPLEVTVTDSSNNPLNQQSVTFTAPGSTGPGGKFDSSQTVVVLTNANGVAVVPNFTANCQAGSYKISADVNGAATPAFFYLTNIPGSPKSIVPSSGTLQSATHNTAFASPLKALIRDGCNNPLKDFTVLFSAPSSGASGFFPDNSATALVTTDVNGIATSPTFTANSTLGSYNVSASVIGFSVAGVANFNLTNKAGPPASLTVADGSTPQETVVNSPFGNALGLTVKDADNYVVSGVSVKFSAPTSGASGTFNGSNNVTVTTNAAGFAVAPTFTANCKVGSYSVVASIGGVSDTATFNLTNKPGNPASIIPISGFGQQALISTDFATAMKAQVNDGCGNPLSNQTVIFTAPASGAGGTFSGNQTSFSGTTDASGRVTAPTFTANGTTGQYSISASVVGFSAAGTINFNLANLPSDFGNFTPGTYQINPALNGTITMPNFTPPLHKKWSVDLDGMYGFVTYAVAAQHKVFALSSTPNMGYGSRLWALNPATGEVLWGPVKISHTYYYGAMAYDNGRLFVLDDDGKLSAFEAVDGSFVWSVNSVGGFVGYDIAPPVAANGFVFTRGAGTLHAHRASDGLQVWSQSIQPSNDTFMHGPSVFVGDDGVYVAGSCQKAFKFRIFDGSPIWTYNPGCPYQGQEGTLYNNRIYVRAGSNPPGLILDASNGSYLGNWLPTSLLPSFAGNTAFVVNSNGQLEGHDATTGTLLWTKQIQNASFSVAPVVINNIAYVGSSNGSIYGYDVNGNVRWQGTSGAPNGIGDLRLISGLSAGEGLLLVPTGKTLVAFEADAPVPGFSSNPAPSSTIDLGNARLGTNVSSSISISETGTTTLTVSNPVLSGANAGDFGISGATFPLNIADGGAPQSFTVNCTPANAGLHTAVLTLTTNDPNQNTVTYNLKCAGTLVVVESSDNGLGDTPGTLSYYLTNQHTIAGQTISFNLAGLPVINVTGPLPPVPAGVILDGGNCSNSPVTLDGSQALTAEKGLVLQGQNSLKNLKVTHFPGQQIITKGTGNKLMCVVAKK